jgi:hypothetical protein
VKDIPVFVFTNRRFSRMIFFLQPLNFKGLQQIFQLAASEVGYIGIISPGVVIAE